MTRQHKYRAVASTCQHGHKHPSKREARRCDELHMLARAGQILGLVYEPQYWFVANGEQIKHPNGRRVGYKPDFGYTEGNRAIVEDVKSKATMTSDAVLRMALFRHLFPDIELRVTT